MFIAFVPRYFPEQNGLLVALIIVAFCGTLRKSGAMVLRGASLIYRRTPLSATLPRNGVPTEDLRQRGTGWQLSDTTGQLRFGSS